MSVSADELWQIFEYKEGALFWKKRMSRRVSIGDEAGCRRYDGYTLLKIRGESHRVHRLIFLMHHGYMPHFIDHINGNRSDNRIENLRACSPLQNARNRCTQTVNKAGFRGIRWVPEKKKFKARICVDRKQIHLGYYVTKEEAAAAYDSAAIRYHGEFASPNTKR